MKPTSSWTCTQQPVTYPYSDQIKPNHFHHTSYLMSVFMLALICSCLEKSHPHQNYVYTSPPFVPHTAPILSTSITSPNNNLISTNHEAPHCATLSSPPLFPPSPAPPQRSIHKCPQSMFFPQCHSTSVRINNNNHHYKCLYKCYVWCFLCILHDLASRWKWLKKS